MLPPANSPSFPIQGVSCIAGVLKVPADEREREAVTTRGGKSIPALPLVSPQPLNTSSHAAPSCSKQPAKFSHGKRLWD